MILFLGKGACHFKYSRMNKKFSLKNKTAVITGGGSGIGKAISFTLASQDAFVHVLDNQFESALETIDHIKKNNFKYNSMKSAATSAKFFKKNLQHLI